jgi:formylglycine-generating enzyme required for sulfatase activity
VIRSGYLTRRTFLRAGGFSLAWPLLDAMQEDPQYGVSALIDGTTLVSISPGEFLMGSKNGNPDERPVHRVRISRPFEMGKFEVTQAQWEGVMRDAHMKPGTSINPSHFQGRNLPVESVTWEDVQRFLERLNARDTKHEYRLPTEAEWEYACRAGNTEELPANLDQMAWYERNSGDQTHPVAKKDANAWGLYDMLGNVAEWAQDWYDPEYYEGSPHTDPKGPDSGSYRIFRGGCWFDGAKVCRPAQRGFDFPSNRFYNVGFRVVRTSKE